MTENEKIKQNKERASANEQFAKMTQTPVNRLIASLAAPTVISMLITTIYNVTDTFFVSQINVSASGATGVVFSLMAIIQAFGFMFGHGSGSCISRHLGAKQLDDARKYASTGTFLALISGGLITLFGLLLLEPFMELLGSTPTILPYSCEYAKYILISAPAMTVGCVFNNILRYEGMASLAMIGLAAGSILNIALDPLLIFYFDMGIAGAGVSTAISQYISLLLLFGVFLSKKTQSRISIKYISLKYKTVSEIIFTGAPSLARQGLNSISNMLLNLQAAVYGDACIAAMSIVAKCANLIFCVCVGIGQGFQPVCSFNYGAKKYARVKQGIKFTWIFGSGVVFVLSCICFAFAEQIVTVFRDDAQVLETGVSALRLLCASLIFLPTVMVANMTFQSIGKTGRAFFLACAQNGLLFIPLILTLPRFLNETGIIVSQPLAYVAAALIAVPFLLSFMKTLGKTPSE